MSTNGDTFETEAELTLTINQQSLRDARDEIESAIDDPTARLDVAGTGGGSAVSDGSGRYDGRFIGRRIDDISSDTDDLVDMADYRNRLLEDLLDVAGGGGGGDGDGPLPRRRPGGGGGGGGGLPLPIPLPVPLGNPFSSPNGEPGGQPAPAPSPTPSPGPSRTPQPNPSPGPTPVPPPTPRTPGNPFGRPTDVPGGEPTSEIPVPEDGGGSVIPEVPVPDVDPSTALGAGFVTAAGGLAAQTIRGGASAAGSAAGAVTPLLTQDVINRDNPVTRGLESFRESRGLNNPDSVREFAEQNGTNSPQNRNLSVTGQGATVGNSGGSNDPLSVNVDVNPSVSIDPSGLRQLRQQLKQDLSPEIADDVVARVEQAIPSF